MESLKCCICCNKTDQDSITECNHIVCKSCIHSICTTQCPICRTDPFRNAHMTDEILELIQTKHINQVHELCVEFPSNIYEDYHFSDDDSDNSDHWDSDHWDSDDDIDYSIYYPRTICPESFYFVEGDIPLLFTWNEPPPIVQQRIGRVIRSPVIRSDVEQRLGVYIRSNDYERIPENLPINQLFKLQINYAHKKPIERKIRRQYDKNIQRVTKKIQRNRIHRR